MYGPRVECCAVRMCGLGRVHISTVQVSSGDRGRKKHFRAPPAKQLPDNLTMAGHPSHNWSLCLHAATSAIFFFNWANCCSFLARVSMIGGPSHCLYLTRCLTDKCTSIAFIYSAHNIYCPPSFQAIWQKLGTYLEGWRSPGGSDDSRECSGGPCY